MAADPIQPSADPDATILNASAELDKLEREYIAVNAASEDDERLSEISDAQTPWVELLTETGAKTIAGIQAKARSLALWEPSLVKATAGDTGRLLTSSILADLLRDVRPPGQLFGAAAAPPPVPPPDAAIFAACENVRHLRRQRDQKPALDQPTFEVFSGLHRDALMHLANILPTTVAGVQAVSAVILKEADDEMYGSVLNALFCHDISEQAALVLLKRLAGPVLLKRAFPDYGAPPAANPDAELIALCDECCRLEDEADEIFRREADASSPAQTENEQISGEIHERSQVLFDRVETMEPATVAGRAAVARVAVVRLAHGGRDNHRDQRHR